MGKREAVGVISGTDALLLAFRGLGLGAGDDVITTSNTFFATAEAIWLAGATPVFVDCDPRTRNINVTKIEEAITSKTRAIVPVHLYGLPASMPEIAKTAKRDRKSTRLNSSHGYISYAVFCLQKKTLYRLLRHSN